MVLLVQGCKVDEFSESGRFYHSYPHLKDTAAQLTASLPKQVGPQGLLYVSQREFAAVSPHDSMFLYLLIFFHFHGNHKKR